jgi:ABC-type branched-subunit amino acid transport system ATPase component
MALLETQNLIKHFGGVRAVDGLDLHVQAGEIVSLIGPNGAGKTTVFNLITGLCAPDGGDIVFESQSLMGLAPYQIAAQGIARTFQTLRLFTNMSILENVMVGQHARGRASLWATLFHLRGFRREEARIRRKAEEVLAFFDARLVGFRLDQLAYSLSYANRRRLEIARAMASEPTLLLLDEPTAGMNPHETEEMTAMIGRLRDEKGYTILLIEHDMHVVRGVSDRVIVLDHGCKIAEGDYDDVTRDARVIEAYLGKEQPCGL